MFESEWSILDSYIVGEWSWEQVPYTYISTYLYFIQQGDSTGPIKIGISKNPKKRLHTLQIGNAVPLTLLAIHKGTFADEQKIHQIFKEHHIQGEWFDAALPLLMFIEELKDS